MTTNSGWARPELICSTEELADQLGDPDLVLLDCDLLPAYQRLHLPGAIWSQSRYWKSDPSNDSEIYGLEDPELFASLCGRMGITPESKIVAYDGSGGLYAARTWWTFDRFGHSDFRILDGGLDKWHAEGRGLNRENVRPARAEYAVPAAPHDETICRLPQLREHRGAAGAEAGHVLWDVRSDGEWTGANARGTARGSPATPARADRRDVRDNGAKSGASPHGRIQAPFQHSVVPVSCRSAMQVTRTASCAPGAACP